MDYVCTPEPGTNFLLNHVQGDNFGLLLGWVDFVLVVAQSAWKGGNLAELDTVVEQPNQSQPSHVTNKSYHPVSAFSPSSVLHRSLRPTGVLR